MNTTIHPFRCKRIALLLSLLLILPFPGLSLLAEGDEQGRYLPGGMPFGVRFSLCGVPIESITRVFTESGIQTPAADAGLQAGDLLLEIDSSPVTTAGEVCDAIAKSYGKPLLLKIARGGSNEPIFCTLRPVASLPDGVYRAGMWIRDSTAGIGTVTLLDPESGAFAGLGHGICRSEDGQLLPLLQGKLFQVRVQGIFKGQEGTPGQLRGSLYGDPMGSVLKNIHCGIFGMLTPEGVKALASPHAEPMPVASSVEEIRTGEASILCTIDGDAPREYRIRIEKRLGGSEDGKNFLLRITDEQLLARTGGIVQGMSGSPVLQNGKIIGAVTHVLVDDPGCGYGIFIGNMLKELPDSRDAAA